MAARPVDGGAERTVTLGTVGAVVAEYLLRLPQAVTELARGQQREPRGGQFQRQGKPVQKVNQIKQGISVSAVGREAGAPPARHPFQQRQRRLVVQRIQGDTELGAQAGGHLRRNENVQLGERVNQLADLAGSVREVLEVVENQQCPPALA
jgi:hypothetical protein